MLDLVRTFSCGDGEDVCIDTPGEGEISLTILVAFTQPSLSHGPILTLTTQSQALYAS